MSEAAVKKAKSGQIFGVVIMAFGMCTGAMLFLMFGKMRDMHAEEMTWPEVQGKVVSSTVSEKEKINRIGRRGVAVITEYEHEWKIGYEVNGKKYTKETSFTYASISEANKFKNRRKVGSPVRLHYKPGRPQVAEIHREAGASPMFGAAIGAFLILFGVLQYWWNSRKLQKLISAAKTQPAGPVEPAPAAVPDLPKQAPGIELQSMKYFEMMSKS